MTPPAKIHATKPVRRRARLIGSATAVILLCAGYGAAGAMARGQSASAAPSRNTASAKDVETPRAGGSIERLDASEYPRGASVPSLVAPAGYAAAAGAGGVAPGGAPAPAPPAPAGSTTPAQTPAPKAHVTPAAELETPRALLAYQAMQKYFYIPGSGLYKGEPYSYLWPFSQAFAATVSLAHIPGRGGKLAHDLHVRLHGLEEYLGPPTAYAQSSGAESESESVVKLRSFNGSVAPPVGPGGDSYYDDNEWVGIELVRLYELDHNVTALEQAEQIMAFVMAGWQADPELACSGGVPFSNAENNTQRNTVTDGPAAELGTRLYQLTGNAQYLQFAEMAYNWVRQCLTQPNGLYADHINLYGEIDTTLWSYNQGSMMGAGTLLYQATGNSAYLFQARQTAATALAYFTPERLAGENPFFVSVYFRNLIYLDSVTHDPPGVTLALTYANYAWQKHRLSSDLFVYGAPASSQLLYQAALTQIYALAATAPSTYF
jgi:hypothetical protein